MAVELVTGFKGSSHVTSAQAGALNAGIIGLDSYVMPIGNKLKLTMDSANAATMATGEAIINGRQVSCATPTTISFHNGTQGQKRHDLVCLRYSKAAGSGIETAAVVVVKGTPGTTASDPIINKGSILSGAALVDFPLWRIPFDGITVGTPVQLFKIAKPLSELADATELTKWDEVWVTGDGKIDARVCRVGSIVYFLASCYDGFTPSTDLDNPAAFTTLPTWARPKAAWRAPLLYISENQVGYAIFKPDGLVTLSGFSASRYWYVCTSYPAI